MIDLNNIENSLSFTAASDNEIVAVEKVFMCTLPEVYKHLLKVTNGFSIGGGLLIYGTDNIHERNSTWGVREYAPGYIAIGDGGGDKIFLMRCGSESKEVFAVEAGDMNPDNAEKVTSDFLGWINEGCPIDVLDGALSSDSIADYCDIVLTGMPANGIKDLLKIKSVFKVATSASQLLMGVKNPPFLLARHYPYGKARKQIEELEKLSIYIEILPCTSPENPCLSKVSINRQ